MPEYVNVGQHAITPHSDKTVGPQRTVELTEDEAEMWVSLGYLVRKRVKVKRPVPKPEPQLEPSATETVDNKEQL